jgi:hypothetical protein
MTEKTGPATPDRSSEAVTTHSLRTRFSGKRLRIRRVPVIAAGSVLVVLVAGGVAWAAINGGPGSPEANDANLGGPGSTNSATPGGSTTSANPSAAPSGSSYPVPTWTPGSPGGFDRTGPGRDAGNRPPPGMPTHLSATRNGDKVVLQWTDNTNNEDGFAIFVMQGRMTFLDIVPAGTTRHEVSAAARNASTCFAVVPFTWTNPVSGYPTRGWACTDRSRSG